jgi:hypothetical protein
MEELFGMREVELGCSGEFSRECSYRRAPPRVYACDKPLCRNRLHNERSGEQGGVSATSTSRHATCGLKRDVLPQVSHPEPVERHHGHQRTGVRYQLRPRSCNLPSLSHTNGKLCVGGRRPSAANGPRLKLDQATEISVSKLVGWVRSFGRSSGWQIGQRRSLLRRFEVCGAEHAPEGAAASLEVERPRSG